MSRIEGYLYKKNTIKQQEAFIVVEGATFTLYSDDAEGLTASIDSLKIPSRVGNTSRKITINEDYLFETLDNNAVDEYLLKTDNAKNWIHQLESKWRVALPAIFMAIAFVSALFVWGIPFASKKIAYTIPESVNEKISKGSFEAIDKVMLTPSALPKEKRELIRQKFNLLVKNYSQSQFNYRLHFRKMADQPNAFALPDGNIVVTDKLVEHAGDKPEEVLTVLLHEIGHVEHRHGLRLALEASSTALLLSMVVGDFILADDFLISLPTILSTSAYSRDHEEEADDFALKYMQEAGINPENFGNILAKIMHIEVDVKQEKNCSDSEICDQKKPTEKAFDYLSSHPVTEERILKAKQAAKWFNKRLN